MANRKRFLRLIEFLLIWFFLSSGWAEAQPDSARPAIEGGTAEAEVEPPIERHARLRSILDSIDASQQELRNSQSELLSPEGRGREEVIQKSIAELSKKIESLKISFTEIATEMDLGSFSKEEEKTIQWQEELQVLLSPLLNEVKRLTSRPREIDHYRSMVSGDRELLKSIDSAVQHLDEILSAEQVDTRLASALKRERKSWLVRRQEIETELGIAQQKLEIRLGEKKPIGATLRDISNIFFKSRGRNLFVAFLTTLAFWLLLRRFQHRILRVRADRRKSQSFRFRLFSVLYLFFTGIGSIFVFMLVLFFFGDWVLLLLGTMFLLGLVWSSRQALPRFWNQAALLLNMGAVREGERVVINGLAWRVKSLNFYTHLENPELEGGSIRLPLRDIGELRSRVSAPGEVWFPTRCDDWVVLSDETYGRVVHQGLERVRVVEPGGSIISYSVSDFVALHPRVLTQGFRISVAFGLDYKHQSKITGEIREELESDIRSGIIEEFCSAEDATLQVEFAEAAGSSLNFAILADFGAGLGSKYQKLGRAIQKLAVESCNRHGWVIPFEQLSLHVEDSVEVEQRAGNGRGQMATE